MKKIFTLVSLAAAVCACSKNGITPSDYGYIEVAGISNDVTVTTKATQNVNDISSWTIKVEETAYTGPDQKFTAGTYTVTASNYADEAAANASKSGWGDAFYTGSNSVTVTAGQTADVTIACGKAHNARLAVVFNTATFGTFITDYSVTVTKDGVGEGLVFNSANTDAKAYFAANTANVAYTIKYKYNGEEKQANGTITLGAAATEKKITISANNNGTITVTISYDDEFTEVGGDSFEIDAATGEKITE